MTLPKKIEQKHMDKLGKSLSKKEHERYKSCVGLTTLPSLMFMLSFYDSIVRWLILNQGKNGSLSSNAYTGRSMLKSKIAQATPALESPVGGLVIAISPYASVHQTVAPCLNVQERNTTILGRK